MATDEQIEQIQAYILQMKFSKSIIDSNNTKIAEYEASIDYLESRNTTEQTAYDTAKSNLNNLLGTL